MSQDANQKGQIAQAYLVHLVIFYPLQFGTGIGTVVPLEQIFMCTTKEFFLLL